MSELIQIADIEAGDVVGGATVRRTFRIAGDFVRWTVLVVPKNDTASPDAVSMEVLYGVGDEFFTTNPASGPSTANLNEANVVTREDSVTKIAVDVTFGATAPDEAVLLRLYGTRA